MATMLRLALAASFLAAWLGSAFAADPYQTFSQKWAAGQKSEACEGLGEANSLRAAKMLANVILQQLVPAKNEKPAEAKDRLAVVDGAVKGLAKMRDPAVLKYLSGEMAGNTRFTAEQRAPFISALGKMKTPEAAAQLVALRGKARAIEDKVALAEAMEANGDGSLVETWLAELKVPIHLVQIPAIRALARKMAAKGVPGLIALVGSDHPEVDWWAQQALIGMTGEDFGSDAKDWQRWWTANQTQPLKGKGLGSEAVKKSGSVEVKTPTYYGIKFQSKRVIFIIDISGSMGAPVKEDLKKPPQESLDKVPAAMRYDWSKIRDRLDLATAHLVYTIAHLDQRTWFNVFYYAAGNRAWQPKLVQATTANKVAAIEHVKKLRAGGGTNIYEALEQAFNIPPQGTVEGRVKEGVDTIFLMTDGEPTSGKLTTASHKDYRERFVQAVQQWNVGRKVKVYTVGVGDEADSKLLNMIAQATGGTYTPAGGAK